MCIEPEVHWLCMDSAFMVPLSNVNSAFIKPFSNNYPYIIVPLPWCLNELSCLNGAFIMLKKGLHCVLMVPQGQRHDAWVTKNDNQASMHNNGLCTVAIWCIEKFCLTLKRCFLFNNHKNSSINFKLRGNFGICASLKSLVYSGQYSFIVEVNEIKTL